MSANAVCQIFKRVYGKPRLGNKYNSLNEYLYILLSVRTTYWSFEKVYKDFKKKYPTWEKVYNSRLGDIAWTIRKAGLSNQKTHHIKETLRLIKEDFGSFTLSPLKRYPDQKAEEYLLSLPGIGLKAAKCIMMYSLGRDVLPVDTHTQRISERLGFIWKGEGGGGVLRQENVYERRKEEHLFLAKEYLDSGLVRRAESSDANTRLSAESELIITVELLRNGHKLQKKTSDDGPDIEFRHNERRVWVEVVAPVDCEKGLYPKLKNAEFLENGRMAEINSDNCKVKIASVISDKTNKFATYRDNGLVEKDDISVICVNLHNYCCGSKSCPYMASVLYGLEEIFWVVPKSLESGVDYVEHKPIAKPNKTQISMGLFFQEKYGCIDGVLWFDYSIGTIVPEECEIYFYANQNRRNMLGTLFGEWKRVFWEGGIVPREARGA